MYHFELLLSVLMFYIYLLDRTSWDTQYNVILN